MDDLDVRHPRQGSAQAHIPPFDPPPEGWPASESFDHVLARARAFDQSALTLLYRRFMPLVYRYVLARVGDIHHAEDLTSEVFFAAIEQMSTTRAQDELGFVAWLLGIARNKVALHFRQQRAHPEGSFTIAEHDRPSSSADDGDPLAIITTRESWDEVVSALNRLTEEQRAVLLYRCILGYATEDVARLMRKRPGTIRALQFRALASLARLLGITPRHDRSGKEGRS